MLWILHYILFNSGLSAVLILLTLFLQTYSKASMSEIGLLLMALPFLAVFIKPVFCALADRQRAHRSYMIGALIFMALGYGSLIVFPCFFPELIEESPELVWYCDVAGIVIGFSAFGLTWSLGDALSVEAARRNNISWGTYRVWGTVSWGFFGVIIGQFNESPLLPKFVPAFIVLVASAFIEAALIGLWPKSAFEAAPASKAQEPSDASGQVQSATAGGDAGNKWTNISLSQQQQQTKTKPTELQVDPERGSLGSVRGLDPRMVASVLVSDLGSSLRSSLRLAGARRRAGLDEIIAEHAQSRGATPPSSPPILMGAGARRCGSVASHKNIGASSRPSPMVAAALANALAAKADAAGGDTPPSKRLAMTSPQQVSDAAELSSGQSSSPPPPPPQQKRRDAELNSGGSLSRAATFGRTALRRTQLALQRLESLSAASGNAIPNELRHEPSARNSIVDTTNEPNGFGSFNSLAQHTPQDHSTLVMMSSLASGASVTRANAAHLKGFGAGLDSAAGADQMRQTAAPLSQDEPSAATTHAQLNRTKSAAEDQDLQLVLLKLIIRRDSNIWKLLFVFTFFGALMTAHITYFFVHVERLCRLHDVTFSSVSGAMLASHSLSEIFSFLVVVPYYVTRVGHACSFATCGAIHAIRFFYYGTLYPTHSPYMGLLSEVSHGIIYGVIYSLITDIANECVNSVDAFLPELVERGVVEPDIDPNELKLPLRATMQGVFSGAFDGLGNGLGALAGGIYLDHYTFSELWLFCAYAAILVGLFYPLTEWRRVLRLCTGARRKRAPQQQIQRDQSNDRPMSKLEQHV